MSRTFQILQVYSFQVDNVGNWITINLLRRYWKGCIEIFIETVWRQACLGWSDLKGHLEGIGANIPLSVEVGDGEYLFEDTYGGSRLEHTTSVGIIIGADIPILDIAS